eukprot:TRINITY_DN48691_c0_g1_i1.p1 TRINITY_DN48691_c0_g1~~TRINITY_DN48691_c0_g1_i1.p1  ORF type:complete len:124 (+),score=13.03 TRINITY_DN48691_c0_g1_i1:331-702(+)
MKASACFFINFGSLSICCKITDFLVFFLFFYSFFLFFSFRFYSKGFNDGSHCNTLAMNFDLHLYGTEGSSSIDNSVRTYLEFIGDGLYCRGDSSGLVCGDLTSLEFIGEGLYRRGVEGVIAQG